MSDDDDDLLTRLLAYKGLHLPPRLLRDAAEIQQGKGRGRSLLDILRDSGAIPEEQCLQWLPLQVRRDALKTLVDEERQFWGLKSKRFGPWLSTELIGGGGRGKVFEGRRAGTEKPVAVKVLAQDHSFDLDEVERFLREADLLSGLRHPGIIPVLDRGWVGSIPYYVMEYVRGTSWSASMELMLAESWPIAVLLSVLEILQYLHDQGILHCDVKPENVLLTLDGKVYLVDFGVALRSGECIEKGTAIGTPVYMSPEQAKGGVPLDERSDLYSAGAVLYEMLTRHQPYRAESKKEIVQRVLAGSLERPRTINPQIPEALEQIVLKAMARNPRHRYGSASEMAADLQRWQAGDPVEAREKRFWEF